MMTPKYVCLCSALIIALTLSACGKDGIKSEAKYPTGNDRNLSDNIYEEPETIFGDSSLFSFGKKDKKKVQVDNGLEINSYLWRASLDTISFMPLASADPFGGVIITEWYQPPATPDERFKANIFIVGRELRTNGLTAKVFRQKKVNDVWQNIDPSPQTNKKLEDTILTRARALRVDKLGSLEIIEK